MFQFATDWRTTHESPGTEVSFKTVFLLFLLYLCQSSDVWYNSKMWISSEEIEEDGYIYTSPILLYLSCCLSIASHCGGIVLTVLDDDQGSKLGNPCHMFLSVIANFKPVSQAHNQSIFVSHNSWSEGTWWVIFSINYFSKFILFSTRFSTNKCSKRSCASFIAMAKWLLK